MNVKPCDLLNSASGTTDRNEHPALLFIVVATLLAGIIYLFVQHAIPVISDVICDFLNQSFETAGGVFL